VQWTPWIDTERKMREALKVLDEFAYGIIKERRQDSDIATKTGNPHATRHDTTHTLGRRTSLYLTTNRVRYSKNARPAVAVHRDDGRRRGALHG
jgi:hypothetical protein